MNRSLRTLLDTGELPGGARLFEDGYFKHRPDVFAVYLDKRDGKFKLELHEVLSQGNVEAQVRRAMDGIQLQVQRAIPDLTVVKKDLWQLDP
jgi:hypothetical protein